MEILKSVTIYSDGSSRGNPGPGGYGTILKYVSPSGREYVREFSGGYSETTNNRMELLGVIRGLEALKEPCEVTVVSDSQYVINAFKEDWVGGWIRRDFKNVKNPDLWRRLLQAAGRHRITWQWVKGHAGHPENERCDRLATEAADKENNPADEGYIPTEK